ncbi:PTS sugar transporter subunit IIA [Brachybacterium sp. YJGR34]|uniref:PTS sugar transporter subunit IIA n=1 Tax=Brachybacterium sp. YJGR34 TaxID=2059911 RepID=UPI000E0A5181|nr:PTS sugar transporter subunit IIA [Brachybacterium sp. YJGR34]
MSTDPRPSDAGERAAPLVLRLAVARLDAADAEDVLRALSGRLLAAGVVTAEFPDALLDRERRFPTGLPTPIPTAIPHAEPGHVLSPGLVLATLRRPLPFGEMGGSGGTVGVSLVAMPLLTDAREHLRALRRLMGLLRDEAAVDHLLGAEDDSALRERAAAFLDAAPAESAEEAGA